MSPTTDPGREKFLSRLIPFGRNLFSGTKEDVKQEDVMRASELVEKDYSPDNIKLSRARFNSSQILRGYEDQGKYTPLAYPCRLDPRPVVDYTHSLALKSRPMILLFGSEIHPDGEVPVCYFKPGVNPNLDLSRITKSKIPILDFEEALYKLAKFSTEPALRMLDRSGYDTTLLGEGLYDFRYYLRKPSQGSEHKPGTKGDTEYFITAERGPVIDLPYKNEGNSRTELLPVVFTDEDGRSRNSYGFVMRRVEETARGSVFDEELITTKEAADCLRQLYNHRS